MCLHVDDFICSGFKWDMYSIRPCCSFCCCYYDKQWKGKNERVYFDSQFRLKSMFEWLQCFSVRGEAVHDRSEWESRAVRSYHGSEEAESII